jgi:hypothetical protein
LDALESARASNVIAIEATASLKVAEATKLLNLADNDSALNITIKDTATNLANNPKGRSADLRLRHATKAKQQSQALVRTQAWNVSSVTGINHNWQESMSLVFPAIVQHIFMDSAAGHEPALQSNP